MSGRRAWVLLILFAALAVLAAIPATVSAAAITEYRAGLAVNSHPRDLSVGPDGNVWFTTADNSTAAIGKITPSGTITTFSAGLNAGSEPWEITPGPDDNLWFTDDPFPGEGTPAIGRITTAGAISEFSTAVNQDDEPIELADPQDIIAGPDGNLWFANRALFGGAPAIGRVTPAGAITLFELPGGSFPQSLVAGPDGNVWFSNVLSPSIGKITPSGTITEYPTPERLPGDLIEGPGGKLWFTASVVETEAPAIGTITTSGTITEYSAGFNPGSQPLQLVNGPDGNVWFTDIAGASLGPTTRAIGRITPAGVVTEFPLGEDSRPQVIVSAPDGNLWATDADYGRLYRVTPSGAITTFTAGLVGLEPRDLIVGPGDSNLWLTDGGAFTSSGAIGKVSPVGPAGVSPEPTLGIHFAGNGSGTVTAAPPWGLACAADCSHAFEAGDEVELEAKPSPGSTFLGWVNDPFTSPTGGACEGEGACQLTIGGDIEVTAEFRGEQPSGNPPQGGSPSPSSGSKPKRRGLRCPKGSRKKRRHGKVRCVRVKRHRCRKGFRKKRVRGKVRCVRVTRRHHA
jgi:streptogramin lyase